MIFELLGAGLALVLSAVFFDLSYKFAQRTGHAPPTILYKKDEYGLKEQEIVWQTPQCTWDAESIGFTRFILFVVRWLLIAVAVFLIADSISAITGYPTAFPFLHGKP